jgi:hypothetical protein
MPVTKDDFRPVPREQCKCGHICCVCALLKNHHPLCSFKMASAGVGVECGHGRDVCPICDPCTCDIFSDEVRPDAIVSSPKVCQ